MECKLSMGLKKGLVGVLSKVQLNIGDHTAVLFMPSALQTSLGPEQVGRQWPEWQLDM